MWQRESAYYRTRFPEYASVLDVAEAIFREQDMLAEERRGQTGPVTADDLAAAAARLAAVYPDGPALAAMLREALATHAPEDPFRWARAVACEATSAFPGDAGLPAFVAVVLAPLHDHLRRPDVGEPDAATAACPACDGPPLMARFRQEDGARLLGCAFCRSEWAYLHTRCPGCGNRDPASLRFFYVEGDRGHRVEVCDLCRAYLKASDERLIGRSVVLCVEDVVTGHLDLLAAEAGYQRLKA
jgi:formate dehydrogenase maturation protein FdhE